MISWVNPIEAENVYRVKANKSDSKKIKHDAIFSDIDRDEFIKINKLDWKMLLIKMGQLFI